MTTYLVDFENVHHHGLTGIEKLTSDDFVIIFLGRTNLTINIDAAISITRTAARVLWKKTDHSGKNYVDIQLASYLGSLIGENKGTDFRIVSKDQGFHAAVDFWRERRKDITIAMQDVLVAKMGLVQEKKEQEKPARNTSIHRRTRERPRAYAVSRPDSSAQNPNTKEKDAQATNRPPQELLKDMPAAVLPDGQEELQDSRSTYDAQEPLLLTETAFSAAHMKQEGAERDPETSFSAEPAAEQTLEDADAAAQSIASNVPAASAPTGFNTSLENEKSKISGSKEIEKLKPAVKKAASTVLKKYDLVGGNFKKIHDIIRKSRDDDMFVKAISHAYLGDKYVNLGKELLPAFRLRKAE